MSSVLIIVSAVVCSLLGILALVAFAWLRTERKFEAEDTALREGLGASADAVTWARHENKWDDGGLGGVDSGLDAGADGSAGDGGGSD